MIVRKLLPHLPLIGLGLGLGACELKEKNLSDPNTDTGDATASGDATGPATTAATEAATGDATGPASTGLDTAAATGDTGPGECGDPSMFPGVDKVCAADQDCALVLHQLDCCGSMKALGIDADDVDAFNESEAACVALFPGCGCAPQPTIAEDGKSEQDGTIVVACVEGMCQSSVQDGPPKWYTTCGDPVCSGYIKPDGVAPCTAEQLEGALCDVEGATCDPMSECNSLLVCAVKDPKQTEQGCPISRAKFKTGIEYLQTADLERHAADLQSLRLATYRYRDAPADAPPRLGIILEDNEQGIWVDARHDRVDLYGYASLAVATLQLQQRQIAVMQAEIDRLAGQLEMSPLCGP